MSGFNCGLDPPDFKYLEGFLRLYLILWPIIFDIPKSAAGGKMTLITVKRNSHAPWYHSPVNIAFTLPGVMNIFTSSLVLAVGAAAGLASLAWNASDDSKTTHINAGIWALVGGLIGGRALYIALHWPYFQSNLVEIIQAYRGGLSWAGALFGAIAAMLLLSWNTQRAFGKLADRLLPLVFAVSVSAWLGCWLTGCAYGQLADVWWALPAKDEWGVIEARVPVQLLAILLSAGVFWLVSLKREQTHIPGQTAGIFIIGLSIIYFLLTYLRVDPYPVWAGLRWDAWAALSFSAVGAAYYLKLIQINS